MITYEITLSKKTFTSNTGNISIPDIAPAFARKIPADFDTPYPPTLTPLTKPSLTMGDEYIWDIHNGTTFIYAPKRPIK